MRRAIQALFQGVLAGVILAAGAQSASADLRALARLDVTGSSIVDRDGGVDVTLALSQAVPYRVYTVDAPMQLVLEFRELAFDAPLDPLDRSDTVGTLIGAHSDPNRPGYSALILPLLNPVQVTQAELQTTQSDGAIVKLRLEPISLIQFAEKAGDPLNPNGQRADAPGLSAPVAFGERLVVALDPGHGGTDPGSQHDGLREADLTLQFARDVKEALLRAGVDEVVLTRDADVFVSLPARISAARVAKADLFLSLHADAGFRRGAQPGVGIYSLPADAVTQASGVLAQRQNRRDMVGGADLRGLDDDVATVLMDLARQDTAPRTHRLAGSLLASLAYRGGPDATETPKHPTQRLEAAFSILKAPDIPSLLIGFGLLSDPDDRQNLQDPDWRALKASRIGSAVTSWAMDEAARAQR